MDEGNVPRRLKRFYRNGTEPPSGTQDSNRVQAEEDVGRSSMELDMEDTAPSGRKLLKKLPGMDYDDLPQFIDESNYHAMEAAEQRDLEQKIALTEIEKFKRENKRLPSKEEAAKLAENIYSQLKDTAPEEAYPEAAQKSASEGTAPITRHQRGRAGRNTPPSAGPQSPPSFGAGIQKDTQTQSQNPISLDMKKLLQDSTPNQRESGIDKEFDLGLGDDSNSASAGESVSDLDDIEKLEDLGDFNLEGPKKAPLLCPSCGKEAVKTIFCPKCGNAFCDKCAKNKKGNEVTCPKCGTKTKA